MMEAGPPLRYGGIVFPPTCPLHCRRVVCRDHDEQIARLRVQLEALRRDHAESFWLQRREDPILAQIERYQAADLAMAPHWREWHRLRKELTTKG